MLISEWKGCVIMKKDTLKICVILAIALVLYNVIVFLIPFAGTAVFWISYLFGLGAFTLVGATIYLALIKNSDAKSRFYGQPIIRIGAIYGLIQMVLCILFMSLGKWVPWWSALLVNAMGLSMAVVGVLSAVSVVEHVRTLDVQTKQETALMRGLQTKLSTMATQYQYTALSDLCEEFRYSDPVSCAAASSEEVELYTIVEALQNTLKQDDEDMVENLCRKAMSVLAERNRLCKQAKD